MTIDPTEVAENTRLGFHQVTGIHERYVVTDADLEIHDVSQRVAVLKPVGKINAAYAPAAHPEIVGEVAKLRDAPETEIVRFYQNYGSLGFNGMRLAERGGVGPYADDPIEWVRAHANGIHVCFMISAALRGQTAGPALLSTLEAFVGLPIGIGSEVAPLSLGHRRNSVQLARELRRSIINPNLNGIRRKLVELPGVEDRSAFEFISPMSVCYWHLANALDGGFLHRCEADGCGAYFIKTDARQRFCPKRWRQSESPCAMRQRQRDGRK